MSYRKIATWPSLQFRSSTRSCRYHGPKSPAFFLETNEIKPGWPDKMEHGTQYFLLTGALVHNDSILRREINKSDVVCKYDICNCEAKHNPS